MTAGRSFSLLLLLGVSGIVLLLAAAVRLALGVWPDGETAHRTLDGVCVIVPVHGDFLAHALSYGTTFLLLGVLGLAARYVGQQAIAFRTLFRDIPARQRGSNDARLRKIVINAGISASVQLVASAKKMAFTAGLWRPRIFITTGLVNALPDSELEAVLLHEEIHASRKDPLRTVMARAWAAMLFFLPVLKDLATYHYIRKEIEADAYTIRRQGTRRHVASALYKLTVSQDMSPSGAIAFGEPATVEARIEALRSGQWRGSPFTLSAARWSLLGLLLVLGLIAHPLAEVHGWWAIGLSLAACPAWLVLYWATRSRDL